MTTRSRGGAPGWRENRTWREQRADRIAQQKADRMERKRARQLSRDDEDEDEKEERPRKGKTKKHSRSGKGSAIVTRDRLKTQRSGIERTMAWLVLFLSFLGTIAALHGGFGPLIASISTGQFNQAALLGGVLIQLVVTFLEWYYFDRPLIAWGARVVDTAATTIGYGPLFLAPLAVLLYNRGVTSPEPAAWGIIALISLGIAWFPESRLVD